MNASKVGLMICLCFLSHSYALAETGQAPKKKPCILPVADGGDVTPTEANLHGIIVKADDVYIQIKAKNSKNAVNVKLGGKTEYFTAFGGDFVASELQEGQEAWVWYRNCQKENKNAPAAIVQVYSLDPNDIDPEREDTKE